MGKIHIYYSIYIYIYIYGGFCFVASLSAVPTLKVPGHWLREASPGEMLARSDAHPHISSGTEVEPTEKWVLEERVLQRGVLQYTVD